MHSNPVGGINGSFGVSGTGLPNIPPSDNSDGPFSDGISLLYLLLHFLGMVAKDKFAEIKVKQEQARALHQMSAELQQMIADLMAQGPGAKGKMTDEEIEKLDKLGVKVNGQSVADYVRSCGDGMDAGQFAMVKAAVDAAADKATDFVSEQQLEIQQIMQKLNMVTQMISSLQTLLKDMINTITQGIR